MKARGAGQSAEAKGENSSGMTADGATGRGQVDSTADQAAPNAGVSDAASAPSLNNEAMAREAGQSAEPGTNNGTAAGMATTRPVGVSDAASVPSLKDGERLDALMHLAASWANSLFIDGLAYDQEARHAALRSSLEALINELHAAQNGRAVVATALQTILDHLEANVEPGTCMCCYTYRMIGHEALAVVNGEAVVPSPSTPDGREVSP